MNRTATWTLKGKEKQWQDYQDFTKIAQSLFIYFECWMERRDLDGKSPKSHKHEGNV